MPVDNYLITKLFVFKFNVRVMNGFYRMLASSLNVVVRRRRVEKTNDFKIARRSLLDVVRCYTTACSTVTPSMGVVFDTIRPCIHTHSRLYRFDCPTPNMVLLFLKLHNKILN